MDEMQQTYFIDYEKQSYRTNYSIDNSETLTYLSHIYTYVKVVVMYYSQIRSHREKGVSNINHKMQFYECVYE